MSAEYRSNGEGGFETAYSYVNISPTNNVDVEGDIYVTESGIQKDEDRFYFIRGRADTNDLAYAGWRRVGGVVHWSLIIRDGSSWVQAVSTATPVTGRWYNVNLVWSSHSTLGSG